MFDSLALTPLSLYLLIYYLLYSTQRFYVETKSMSVFFLTAIEIGFLVRGLNITEDPTDSTGEAVIHTSFESEQQLAVQIVIDNPLLGMYIPATICSLAGGSTDVEVLVDQPGILIFQPGQRQNNISFESILDMIPEANERFQLSVNPVPGFPMFSCSEEEPFECFSTFEVIIEDDDGKFNKMSQTQN